MMLEVMISEKNQVSKGSISHILVFYLTDPVHSLTVL